MLYTDFLTIVQAHAKQGGTAYLQTSDTDSYLALINRGLKGFTRYAYSTIDLQQELSLTAGTATYGITPMFEPLRLSVNGSFLHNQDGGLGPSTLAIVSTLNLATVGTPSLWCISDDREITIYPTATTTGYLVGYVEHATIASTGTVALPDHVIDIAALWVSMALRYPHMQGSDLFGQILALDSFAGRKLQGYRAANRARFNAPLRRKSVVDTFYA